jgi:Terpene cyclase DEP1
MALSMATMSRIYLLLAVLGYAAAVPPMIIESIRSGNVLFWTNPQLTISEMFANLTSTSFALDALAVALVALVFITREAHRMRIGRVWVYWVLTLLFGVAGTFPLFLAVRERRLGTV